MLMMATAGIFRLEQQEFLNLTEIHSVVTSRIVTAVDLNKSDHTHITEHFSEFCDPSHVQLYEGVAAG